MLFRSLLGAANSIIDSTDKLLGSTGSAAATTMYPIVFPDRSVILYVRDLSEKNAGQKYRYQILFKLRSGNDIELILYSDQLYKCMSAVFFARYIEKHREYYRFRYQDKVYTIPKEEVETIEFTGSWNIGWW